MKVKKLFFYLVLLTFAGLNSCAKKQQITKVSDDFSVLNTEENLSEAKVLNGFEATIEEFPFVVSQDSCTRSIINKYWILTAGHCSYHPPKIFVGTHLPNTNLSLNKKHGVPYDVEYIKNHPDYNIPGLSGLHETDLRLMKLKTPIVYFEKVAPIAIVKSDELNINTKIILLGWAKGDGNPALIGQPGGETGPTGRFEYIYANITRFFGNYANSYNAQAISSYSHAGTRPGDSGGPGVLRYEDGSFIQVGVNSSSNSIKDSQQTRVSKHYDWIMQTTGLTQAVITENNFQYSVDVSNTTHDGFLSAQAFIIDEKSSQRLEIPINQQGNLVHFDFSLDTYLALKEWKSENFKIEFRFYYGGTYFTKVVSEDLSAQQVMDNFLTDDKIIDLANKNPEEFKKLVNYQYLIHQHSVNSFEKNILFDHILNQELKYQLNYQYDNALFHSGIKPETSWTQTQFVSVFHKKNGKVDLFADCTNCKASQIQLLAVQAINKTNQVVFTIFL